MAFDFETVNATIKIYADEVRQLMSVDKVFYMVHMLMVMQQIIVM
jgi:hypothetical protein